ncbi:protein AbnA [Fennellomyces sp. T-0311]|nr:protein AbnA [Fennellomyces sp. T-0311]
MGAFWNMTGYTYCHDPTVYLEDGRWYGFCTGDGIQIIKSEDGGKGWEHAGQVFLEPLKIWSENVPPHRGLNVWAPDLEYFNDRVWLYYSISTFNSQTSAIFLASADSIGTGSWRDDGLILKSADDYNAIDPNLVIDKDGNPWLSFGSHWGGLKIVSVDPKTMHPDGEIIAIASRDNYENSMEAPSIIYHSDTDYYYLFLSIDYCCIGVDSTYKMVVSRSKDITGPYVDKEGKPVIKHPTAGTIFDTGNDRWIGPGHQDVDDKVIARHAYDATEDGASKLLINDLKFDEDGWPTY